MQPAPSGHGPTRAVHVGRQPIYNLRDEVVAYELLFRESDTAVGARLSDASATINVIINTFGEFGLADIVADKLCFVNVTRDFLVGDLPLPFGPERTVLEVLETVEVDDEVIAGVTLLANEGYQIALDDFAPGSPHEQLLPQATVVKLDVLNTDEAGLRSIVAACAPYPRIWLLAEKVETPEHMALGRRLGCRLFQGYWLSRPTVITGRALSPSHARQMQLLSALARPDVDTRQISMLVSRDPALALRLLRLSNSAAAGLKHRVSSVYQAVTLLGPRRIREWLALMVLGDLTGASSTHLGGAVARARMCQQMAEHIGLSGEVAFTAGLLLGVAELLGVPVAEVLSGLPVGDELTAALVDGHGRLAELLQAVVAYENADLEKAGRAQLPMDLMVHAYVSAAVWSDRTIGTVLGTRTSLSHSVTPPPARMAR
jgi:EAL and modified HD-GYP domain-containing signal transduction protein